MARADKYVRERVPEFLVRAAVADDAKLAPPLGDDGCDAGAKGDETLEPLSLGKGLEVSEDLAVGNKGRRARGRSRKRGARRHAKVLHQLHGQVGPQALGERFPEGLCVSACSRRGVWWVLSAQCGRPHKHKAAHPSGRGAHTHVVDPAWESFALLPVPNPSASRLGLKADDIHVYASVAQGGEHVEDCEAGRAAGADDRDLFLDRLRTRSAASPHRKVSQELLERGSKHF